MHAGLFFIVSSPEAMAKADVVIENLLKVWGIHAFLCCLESRGHGLG
jgi:hypothetical protein